MVGMKRLVRSYPVTATWLVGGVLLTGTATAIAALFAVVPA